MAILESERATQTGRGPMLLRDDTRFAQGRIAIFQYITVAVFLFLLSGFWMLQVHGHEAASQAAERNRIKTVPLIAPRGKILDRDGRVIVDNQPAFSVMLSRENLRMEHIDVIAAGLNLDADDIRTRLKRFASRPKYYPLILKQDLDPSELAFVESHRDRNTFPELELEQSPRRLYPRGGLAGHVIGYVGEVSDQELNSAEFAKYTQGDFVGQAGLERQYNDLLKGVDGQKRVVVDSLGRERPLDQSGTSDKEATPGQTLQLSLDLDLQAVAELSLEGKIGAVVALDPRNGEVLAMASRPSYDPNAFEGGIGRQQWKDLMANPDKPMMNRAIQEQSAPGSTYKPFVSLAGLETGTLDPGYTVHCNGGATFFGHYYHCDLHTGHGTLDLHRAIVHSCDVYFYTVGNRIGVDNIAKYAEMAGLGRKTGVDLPGEAEGLVPSTRWKVRTMHEKWYAGDTISVAVGQGQVLVTPVQLAAAVGGLSEGGVWYRPHLVKGERVEPRQDDLNPDDVSTIISAMCGVVNEGGTGAPAQIPGIEVCGKTGTAQRVSLDLRKSGKLGDEGKDNAWFVGFAPRQNPEIVVAALIEGGGWGASTSPTVRDVIKAYFDKKARLSKPLPQTALLSRPR